MIDGHGDDLYRYGGRIKYNFSSNVYSEVDHSGLMEHLARLGERLKSYPEPEARSLEAKIADKIGVSPEEVLVTNGATEAIYLIAMTQRGRRSHIVAPAFREYQDSCRIHGVSVDFIPDISQISEESSSLWLCNPANPTGHVTDVDTIKKYLAEYPDKLFFIDQAYAAYSVLPTLTPRDAVDSGNVILLSSLTKDFAVPGLRIGYAVGSTRLLDQLRSLRMPWSVNTLAIEAAKYLLDHAPEYKIDAQFLHDEAMKLASSFSDLDIETMPTDCNFLLCKLPTNIKEIHKIQQKREAVQFKRSVFVNRQPSAAALKQFLIDRHGILIRDASNFKGLTRSHFRVAAQSPNENLCLVKAVSEFISWLDRP